MSLLMVTGISGLVYAQAAASGRIKSVRIEDIKPTVYLSLERKSNERLRLRMSNNTNWAIAVRTVTFYVDRKRAVDLATGQSVFTLPGDEEIGSLHYFVEKEPTTRGHLKAPELHYPDSYAISWIPPAGSIIFSVPANHLYGSLMLYVPFHYEWELNGQMIFNKEPEHRVYLRAVDLSMEGSPASRIRK